jgi:hypothetical protein
MNVINRAIGATRTEKRPFRRFWYSLEWLQTAAVVALVLYLGALLLP